MNLPKVRRVYEVSSNKGQMARVIRIYKGENIRVTVGFLNKDGKVEGGHNIMSFPLKEFWSIFDEVIQPEKKVRTENFKGSKKDMIKIIQIYNDALFQIVYQESAFEMKDRINFKGTFEVMDRIMTRDDMRSIAVKAMNKMSELDKEQIILSQL